ncbi:MAG: hypothetical protein A2Y69_14920 [Candidatus Aminicenantes bacterium RBG_13_59_9]|nr:MAG: hypothetical protein A2Y69_14920 [Candidatus Aminicenantes bacterium RBG_13_59_9]
MIIIYALGAVYITIEGINKSFGRSYSDIGLESFSDSRILDGIGIVAIGNFFWRIVCKAAIVLFRIHDSLRAIEMN